MSMRRVLGLLFLAGLSFGPLARGQDAVPLKLTAPELEERSEEEWINSSPLKLAELRGRVVVLHFWAFGCINCVHNQPHYKSWHEKYSRRGLTLIGVHTPETERERDIEALRANVKERELPYPIVFDKDGQTWKTWGNRWWPSTYLIDKKGVVRFRWDGELNWKKTKGESMMRRKIEQLLAEPGPPVKKAKSPADKPDQPAP